MARTENNATDNQADCPLVSIGLPVYNEEKYIGETLDSLLGQNYSKIEIIISDNASTDKTQDICESYAAQNSQIRYLRFAENLGQGINFKRVRDEAGGKFFMWACGHDLWSDNFISACLEKMENNPEAVVIVPTSKWIDPRGDDMNKQSGYSDTRGMDVIARYFTMFWGNMHPAYGLMRSEVIKTWPIREIIGEDLVMMTYLALHGDFVHAADAVWSRREFRFEKSYSDRLKRYKKGNQMVAKTFWSRSIPFVKLVFYLFDTIWRVDLSITCKILISFLLGPSVLVRYFSGKSQYKVDPNDR